MRISQQLAVAVTAGAMLTAPLIAATGADAATPFTVSVLHCAGGIHISAYHTRAKANAALDNLLEQQRDMPRTLRKIQLRHGDHILRRSNKSC